MVVDFNGNPLSGKYCVAMSAVEPAYGMPYGLPGLVSGLEVLYLQ